MLENTRSLDTLRAMRKVITDLDCSNKPIVRRRQIEEKTISSQNLNAM